MFDENDVKIVKGGGPTIGMAVYLGAVAILPGEPVKLNNQYALQFATDAPIVGTDLMLGIAHNTSTHTSTVSGRVEITTILPMRTVLRWNAETTTRVNTQAKINALRNSWITCDLTGTTFTIDEDDTSQYEINGLGVIGGDPVEFTLDVLVSALCTFAAPKI